VVEVDEVELLGRLVVEVLVLLGDVPDRDGENAVDVEFVGRLGLRAPQRLLFDDEPEFQCQLPHDERRRHPSCAVRALGASPPISGPSRCVVCCCCCCCCCWFGGRQSALRAGIKAAPAAVTPPTPMRTRATCAERFIASRAHRGRVEHARRH
jgi:hypothetical protein